jgi:dihydropyrimidine dehydrogenase (NAD+) subunit PreT
MTTFRVDLAPLEKGRIEEGFTDKRPRYTTSEAIAEANRCLYCADAPCIKACPTSIDIPTFIHKISTGNMKGAARTIFEANLLGTSCSRVCPVEVLCVGDCVYNHWDRDPINIGRLQRYATESVLEEDPSFLKKKKSTTKSGKKVALIGAGPASIACAGYLSLNGHQATIFEKRALPGGLNTTGIAPYKLKADDALRELGHVLALGDIDVQTNVEVGDGAGQTSPSALLNDYDAVFIGIGLGKDSALGVPGEDGPGVFGAVALIERLKTDKTLKLDGVKRALVIGGGNTAIDIAHELSLAGVSDVMMVYRRDESAMSGYAHEMAWAREDRVRLVENRVPTAVVRDASGKLTGVTCARTEGGKPIAGTEETMPCDLVAVAIGQARLTELALTFEGVKLDDKGRVVVDEFTCRAGNSRVFAGGDCVNGGKEVVNAVEHGKRAARAMHALFAK